VESAHGREAEANVIRRLERSVCWPSGDVERVLRQVVGNLEVTNNPAPTRRALPRAPHHR
jgi:hypothetical protein